MPLIAEQLKIGTTTTWGGSAWFKSRFLMLTCTKNFKSFLFRAPPFTSHQLFSVVQTL